MAHTCYLLSLQLISFEISWDAVIGSTPLQQIFAGACVMVLYRLRQRAALAGVR